MEYTELSEDLQELVGHLFDPRNALSLDNVMPRTFSVPMFNSLMENPREVIELISDEERLLRFFKTEKSYQPTVNDQRVRYLFWHEYENSRVENRKMVMNNVHSLVCDVVSFRKLFLKLPYRTAFLCCRPAAYQHTLNEMLLHGMQRLRQVLDLPEVDANGKLNTKVIELKIKITAMVDMRIHGAPTQKIHQVTQNLPSLPGKEEKENLKTLIQNGDMATIRRRIEEIEQEKRKLEGRANVVTVEVEPKK